MPRALPLCGTASPALRDRQHAIHGKLNNFLNVIITLFEYFFQEKEILHLFFIFDCILLL
jgi:hypothetical protein